MPHQCDCTLDDQELEALNRGGLKRQVVYTKIHLNLSFTVYDVSMSYKAGDKQTNLRMFNQ